MIPDHVRNKERFQFSGLTVIVLGLACAGLFVPLPNQYRSPWMTKLLDLGHVPLFALVTVCLWKIVGRRNWVALILAALLAVVAEVGQSLIGRSSIWLDVFRGWIGAIMAVFVIQSFTRGWNYRQLAVRMALAMALMAWPIWDSVPVLVDALGAYRSFPLLSDFQSRWEVNRWYTHGARLDRQVLLEPGSEWVGQFQVLPPDGKGGAILFPVIGDWSAYRRLICTFSVAGAPLPVLISIRDGQKVQPPRQRFDLEHTYSAGRHRIAIDLQDLKAGTSFAPVDIAKVQSFHFVVTDPTNSRVVLLHAIYLE